MISITQTPQGWLARITTQGLYRERRHATMEQARCWIQATLAQLQHDRSAA